MREYKTENSLSTLNVEGLAPGVYFISVNDSRKKLTIQ